MTTPRPRPFPWPDREPNRALNPSPRFTWRRWSSGKDTIVYHLSQGGYTTEVKFFLFYIDDEAMPSPEDIAYTLKANRQQLRKRCRPVFAPPPQSNNPTDSCNA